MTTIIFTISFLFIGFFLGYFLSKYHLNKNLEKAKQSAKDIIESAKEKAERIEREAEKKAKEEVLKEKAQLEKEFIRLKKEIERKEKELSQREYQVDKKAEVLLRKEEELKAREREIGNKEKVLNLKIQKVDEIIKEEITKLQEIAGMTREEAKELLLKNVEKEARIEAAQIAHKIREEAKERAEKEAIKIIATAMQKVASQVASDSCITVVPLPSEDMKGRIIGREGRNIRAFEAATGVEIIVDDTPEAVILSSFDPYKRDIARIALEKLIQDGRIHPGRIEEVVSKVEKEMEDYIRIVGEETILELGIRGMHPELLKLIGKMKYRTSFGQNLLLHSKEVAYLAGIMAGELKLDPEIAKRAAILHDIGKVAEPDYEGPHALIGAQLAKRYGENDLVCNAIAAHHEDEEPISPYAMIVTAADAVSGARPGARRESVEAYIKRIEKLEEIASSFPGVEKAYALQAGREIRIVVDANKMTDAEADDLAKRIAKEIEEKVEFPGQIKVTVIREYRATEYAR
jgi:ribonuclease Y